MLLQRNDATSINPVTDRKDQDEPWFMSLLYNLNIQRSKVNETFAHTSTYLKVYRSSSVHLKMNIVNFSMHYPSG